MPTFSAVRRLQLCSAAGPTRLQFYHESSTNSHFRILFWSISPTEETFKRSVHLADVTQAFSPCFSRQSWHGSWCSRWTTETSRHRSLTPAKRLWGSSQVCLTHPVPESHSAAGRLQPFVTSPDRYWMCQTGEQSHSEKGEEGCSTKRAILFMTASLDVHQSIGKPRAGQTQPDPETRSDWDWLTDAKLHRRHPAGDSWGETVEMFLHCNENAKQEFHLHRTVISVRNSLLSAMLDLRC